MATGTGSGRFRHSLKLMMQEQLFRGVELIFTAYMVPALLVPLVWIGGRILKRMGPSESAMRLSRIQGLYAGIAGLCFLGWVAVRFGVPIENGGRVIGFVSWLIYIALNFTLAMLLVAFTGEYGALPEGPVKDRLFARFLSIILVQPVATAFAYAVLYRIMGLVYHMKVVPLPGVQEGI
jgi:hypothetical protein